MPEISWIEALKRYNLGGTAWCIPKKGTPAYDVIMKIRKGEDVKTPKELIAELERKTGGKPKAEKKSMTISLEEKPKAEAPKPKKEKKPKAEKPKKEKKSKAKKEEEDMPVYEYKDDDYEAKLAAFKKMVGAA